MRKILPADKEAGKGSRETKHLLVMKNRAANHNYRNILFSFIYDTNWYLWISRTAESIFFLGKLKITKFIGNSENTYFLKYKIKIDKFFYLLLKIGVGVFSGLLNQYFLLTN